MQTYYVQQNLVLPIFLHLFFDFWRHIGHVNIEDFDLKEETVKASRTFNIRSHDTDVNVKNTSTALKKIQAIFF